jgi:peptide/nickel transport system permease protein
MARITSGTTSIDLHGLTRQQHEGLRGTASWLGHLAARKPLGAFGAVVLILMVLMAVFAGVVAPYDPLLNDSTIILQGPSAQHLAGTDQFGRDIFSRIVYGSRTSLQIGAATMAVAITLSVVVGLVSAYFGGTLDYGVQRFVDAVQAIPDLILLIAIMVILGPSLLNVIIALAFQRAITSSRVVRGATLAVMTSSYIEAARTIGASDPHIMARHVLRNIVPPIIVIASLGFGQVILAEASLSFLGYGVQPPTPSWGNTLSADGRKYMYAQPWLLLAPSIALSLVVFGINMLGDALRDLLDPRLRGAG